MVRRHAGVQARYQKRAAAFATPQGVVALSVVAVGRGDRLSRVLTARRAVSQTAVSYRRGGVTERFRRGATGVRHQVKIERRPEGAGGELKVVMGTPGAREVRASGGAVLLRPERGSGLRYSMAGAVDARGRVLRSEVAVVQGAVVVDIEDDGAAYPVTVDQVAQPEGLLAPAVVGDEGGRPWRMALSADGTTAVVADPGADRLSGVVWIFARVDGAWAQVAALRPSDAVGPARFGSSVAISSDGSTVLVGGSGDHGGYTPHAGEDGAAWVFVRDGDGWSQQGPKLRPMGSYGAAVGGSVALSSDGALAFVAGAGVWVFVREGGSWVQQGDRLAPSDDGRPELLRTVAVSADADGVVVGSPGEDGAKGAARVFERDGQGWRQVARLEADVPVGGRLGAPVAISADGATVVIGGGGSAWPFIRRAQSDAWIAGERIDRSPQHAASTGGFPTGLAISPDGATVVAGDSDGQRLSALVFDETDDGSGFTRHEVVPDGPLQRVGDVGLSTTADTVVVDGQATELAEQP